MRFGPDLLDSIRTRLPVSQIVGRKVKLRRVGREFVGLCCFHQDKKPSLTVNDQKSLFHCFPCGASGDQFGFVMRSEGLSFPEAVERLAREAGVELPATSQEAVKREARKLTLIEINEKAAGFFRKQLASHAPARDYLARRGIGPEAVADFGLGYAPADRSALKQHLAQEGVSQEDMIAAGLLIHGDDIPVSYDRFRDRVIFPIQDSKGRVIGFGGRDLSGQSQAKYLNTSETPIFDKGHALYNINRAREPAVNGAVTLAVEGYTATISASRAGYPATVAPMGTALTADHMLMLWRMSDEPVLCFDGDTAGRKAIRRAIDNAIPLLQPGRSFKIAYLPGGLDPDDLVRQRGADALAEVVGKAVGMGEALWKSETDGRTITTPDDRAALESRLMEAVRAMPVRQHRDKWEREFRDRVNALGRRPKINRSNSNSNHSTSPGSIRLAHGARSQTMPLREAMLLAALVASPHTAVQVIDRIATDQSLSVEAAEAVRGILNVLSELPEADTAALQGALGPAMGTVAEAREICHRAGIVSLDQDGEAAAAILLRH